MLLPSPCHGILFTKQEKEGYSDEQDLSIWGKFHEASSPNKQSMFWLVKSCSVYSLKQIQHCSGSVKIESCAGKLTCLGQAKYQVRLNQSSRPDGKALISPLTSWSAAILFNFLNHYQISQSN